MDRRRCGRPTQAPTSPISWATTSLDRFSNTPSQARTSLHKSKLSSAVSTTLPSSTLRKAKEKYKNDIHCQSNQLITTRKQRHTHRYAHRCKLHVASTRITFKEATKGRNYCPIILLHRCQSNITTLKYLDSGSYPWDQTFLRITFSISLLVTT